ncbi:hypothetical protein JHK87_020218 [Glycine soja]|nr:hypothetical protein JHK87_020218 [Glycine soja]
MHTLIMAILTKKEGGVTRGGLLRALATLSSAANTNAIASTVFSTSTSQPQLEDYSVFDDHENSAEYLVLGLEQTPLPLGSDVFGLGSSCSVRLSNEAVSASLLKKENENETETQWFAEDESFLLDFVYEDNGFVSQENSS